MKSTKEQIQQQVDEFYKSHGPCCAGCDYWRWHGPLLGDCLKSSIMSEKDRVSMIGIANCTANWPAGHAITRRDSLCRNFYDSSGAENVQP